MRDLAVALMVLALLMLLLGPDRYLLAAATVTILLTALLALTAP